MSAQLRISLGEVLQHGYRCVNRTGQLISASTVRLQEARYRAYRRGLLKTGAILRKRFGQLCHQGTALVRARE